MEQLIKQVWVSVWAQSSPKRPNQGARELQQSSETSCVAARVLRRFLVARMFRTW